MIKRRNRLLKKSRVSLKIEKSICYDTLLIKRYITTEMDNKRVLATPEPTNEYLTKTVSEQNRSLGRELKVDGAAVKIAKQDEIFVNVNGMLEMVKQKVIEMDELLSIKDITKAERMDMLKHKIKTIKMSTGDRNVDRDKYSNRFCN